MKEYVIIVIEEKGNNVIFIVGGAVMNTFDYTISDDMGLHARPAGLLVKAAKTFSSEITLTCNGKSVSCKRLMAVMGMGVKCGETVTVTVEGEDCEEAFSAMKAFFEENL